MNSSLHTNWVGDYEDRLLDIEGEHFGNNSKPISDAERDRLRDEYEQNWRKGK